MSSGNRRLMLLLVTLFYGGLLQAQFVNNQVRGRVMNSYGEPLVGATIAIKGALKAVMSDSAGNFTIQATGSNIITINYVGYTPYEAVVKNISDFIFILSPGNNNLNDIVVVGYTTQKRATVTGSVAVVDVNSMQRTKSPDVIQTLQGQVSGVMIQSSTGQPGDAMQIVIRGPGTIGNINPLYIVDGVPTRDISFLDGSDIQSVSVLKDAAATAIYGSRAANGVVIFTTKKGSKASKSIVSVDYYTGITKPTRLPDMLNANQYLTAKDIAWHNTAGNDASAVSPYAALKSKNSYANTNWLDELFTTGTNNKLNVSANGGSDKVQYYLSAGYFSANGIVVENNDMYKRLNLRANVNAEITDRLTAGINFELMNATQDKLSSSGDAPGIIRHALLRPPVLSVYKDPSDPTYNPNDPYTDLPFFAENIVANGGRWNGAQNYFEFTSNPIALVHYTDNKLNNVRNFGNAYLEYSFLSDQALKFRSSYGADVIFVHNKAFFQNFGDNDGGGGTTYPNLGRQNRPNSLTEERGQLTTFTVTNTLNYQKLINNMHNLNILLGQEYIKNKEDRMNGSRISYDNSSAPFRFLDYGSTASGLWNGGSQPNNWALMSFFASANYGFNSKYFLNGTIRADGSSKFGPNNKWAYFPSIAGAWAASKEEFMKNVDWIDNLKLRASWGISGNQEIPNDAYQTVVSQTNGVVNVIRYGNPDLKWESTKQTDIGLDLDILKNHLSVTVDYYQKRTDNILLAVPLPAVSVGVINATFVNAGIVSNKGFELGLAYRNRDHAFKYEVSANASTQKNKVIQLYDFVPNIIDNVNHVITQPGYTINSYYGLQFAGIYQNQNEINTYLHTNTNGAQPGDIKFRDVNGDGQIDDNDRVILGNNIPKLFYGFNFNASYKNFDFSFFFQGVQGVDRYNDLKQILNYDTRPFNSTTAVLNAWSGEGSSNTTPRLTFNDNGGSKVSGVFVENAAYLRLKNIELGYTLHFKRLNTKGFRVYVSGQNLLTFTKYSGLDPESTLLKDQGTYPQLKGFILGTRFSF
ncbi:MAG: TonB-dependent receptor [Chitinophagaceae bacterium]|nr:TonB-dependent receptor [Chitinophagaceae bacterium]